ncbi:MAG: hypothetical protein Q8N81_05975 [bacterium]|nr:hypothetical protein [bacterium]
MIREVQGEPGSTEGAGFIKPESGEEGDERWRRLTLGLKHFEPTGDVMVDAGNFFAADESNPGNLSPTYRDAFAHRDSKVLLEYFRVLWTIQSTPEGPGPVYDYYRAKKETVKRIIDACEQLQRRQVQ